MRVTPKLSFKHDARDILGYYKELLQLPDIYFSKKDVDHVSYYCTVRVKSPERM